LGADLASASAAIGVHRATGVVLWGQSGAMRLRHGHAGKGLDDPPDWDAPPGRFLSLPERRAIQLGADSGLSAAAIAAALGRDRSTVWRELRRGRGPDGRYFAHAAHARAHQRAHRPKPFKLRENPRLCRQVEEWMDQGWSPKLIAHMLTVEHPGDETWAVSHETIYQALYVQGRGNLRQDLARQLATKRTARRSRGSGPHRDPSPYKQALKISRRPPEVADRAVPGHWEGDLIVGPGSRSAIGTLVERATRFVILLHLPERHTADEVASAMIAQMSALPDHLRRSITWDRGSEMAAYETIQLELEAPVYFADPHSPWQRGSNENTNRLLRFWFEKGTDLSTWTAPAIKQVQDTLNRRPRPTLDYKTPAQALNELLAHAP
jgi:IS30 family transposase